MFKKIIFVLLLTLPLFNSCDTDDGITNNDNLKSFDDFVEGEVEVVQDTSSSSVAPLTAQIQFQTEEQVNVSIRIDEEIPVTRTFNAVSTEHSIPVIGLYPGQQNEVVVQLVARNGTYALDTLTIEAPELPDFMPDIKINKADTSRMEPGMNLSNLSLGTGGTISDMRTVPVIFDRNGDIRWYMDLKSYDFAYVVKRFDDGNIWFGSGTSLYKFNMLGEKLNSWQFPGKHFHHEVTQKPDGNVIAAVSNGDTPTVEDYIIEINPISGSIVNEWDLREVLDWDRYTYMENETDWFHMNAIFYDEGDNALIVSGRNQGVVKLTMDNELEWILAPHKGWGKAGIDSSGYETSEYLLTAVDANGNPYPEDVQQGVESNSSFKWSYGQHAPLVLPNGNIFLFDNGFIRNLNHDPPYFSRGVEYQIDEENMTVSQEWQYGRERGKSYYSNIISDVDILKQTGNRLIMPGLINHEDPHYAYITEVTHPDKQMVFEAKINMLDKLGTKDELGHIDIVYRSERLPLYPENTSSIVN